MRNFNGSYLYETRCSGGKRTKMKNRCSSAECKCSPPIVNVHHYQCPLMKTPCPLHGYPFIYNLKSKKTPPDQCLVISFHPSLKTDKLFEPVKTFLNQTCEPDAKIDFQYYSPRLSESNCEEFKHRQVQTNPEDFKKLNSCFVEKTKTFFSDKTNKMKKLKQCFNSPCSSVVHKSRSCTAIREKIDRVFREGISDGYPDKSKLEKRIKACGCMKSEESSHFLYKRDFDLSDGEKSSKEKIDSDFITKINNNLLDHNVFEIRSRKGFNERVGRLSANMRPHFTYTSFVSPDPVKEKVSEHTKKEEVSDLEKTNEESKNADGHLDKVKEDKEEHDEASPDGNDSSESSGSVFTPFMFVPGGNDKEIENQGIQTANAAPKMRCQWVQTIEYFQETTSSNNQTKKSQILVAKTKFIRAAETQTSPIAKPKARIYGKSQVILDEEGKEKPDKTNVAVQTPQKKLSAPLFSDFKFFGNIETLTKAIEKEKSEEAKAPVSIGVQTQETPSLSTVVYYEPEMKFLRRDEMPEDKEKSEEAVAPVSLGTQTQETPILSTVVYYEPEMSFLRREESSEDEKKSEEAVAPVSMGTQTQETPNLSTVVYYEPEMKFLRRDQMPEDKEKSEEAVAPVSLGVQTQETPSLSTVVYYEPEMKFLRRDEMPEDEKKSEEAVAPVSMGAQNQETPILSTVVYYEPEMSFLRREESSEDEMKDVEAEKSKSVGVHTGETTDKKEILPENEEESKSKGVVTQETSGPSTRNYFTTGKTTEGKVERNEAKKPKSTGVQTVVYYEPEMKFLSRAKSLESVGEEQEPNTTGVQAQSVAPSVTVIYFEPETKPLRKKDQNEKRGVFFNDETQILEIDTGTKDKAVGTEPETLEEYERQKYDSVYLTASQNKEIQASSDSDTSQLLFDGSDVSNTTYIVKSYISGESEQVVVQNWNKSRSDSDMLDKKKCNCLMKANQASPPPRPSDGTNRNGLTFVGIYHSKKETYASSKPQDSTKAQLSKPEGTTEKNEDNSASLIDLSDLIRIINENFKKMFDRTTEKCECQQMKEAKPTVDKEVMTDISAANDVDVILQMATRSMPNDQNKARLPNLEEMPLGQSSNPDQEPSTSICKVCSKVISMTTMSAGTNAPDGGCIQTKIQEVNVGAYCENFSIKSNQEASCSKSKSTEKPSTSKEGSGKIKSMIMSTKTFLTKFEKPPESTETRAPAPTRQRNITYPEPFSDSTSSLQRDLRRAQQECGVKPKPSRPTPSPRSKPIPMPRQTQPPQSRPQVTTRVIPDAYCGNIVATITTRRTPSCQIQERCPFEPPSARCENADLVCPLPPRSNPDTCIQRTQPKKEPDKKQNHMTYHVTLSPLWTKDVVKLFQSKLKKKSKSESSVCLSDSSGKQKRNHDGGSEGSPIIKRIKSSEREKTNFCDTSQFEHACFELKKSQADILLEFLMKGENELVLEDERSRLTKDSGFVWVPSYSQFFSIRQVSSPEESAKSKETLKEVSRRHSHVLSKIPEENNHNYSSTKDTSQQNLDYTSEENLIKKLFRCSTCKRLTYLLLKNNEIMEKPKNNSTNIKSSLEEYFKNFEFTSQSHSLNETDEQINSEQKHVESVSSTETNIPSTSSEQADKCLYELFSKFLSVISDSNFEMDLNEVESCQNSGLASLNSDNGFSIPRSTKSSFHDQSRDVSNSEMATESESLRKFQFCAKSNTEVPDSKETNLRKFPSKMFQGCRKKSK